MRTAMGFFSAGDRVWRIYVRDVSFCNWIGGKKIHMKLQEPNTDKVG
jgi:hypothetical protein